MKIKRITGLSLLIGVALCTVASAQENLPEPVQTHLTGIEARVAAEPAVQEGNGSIFDLDYKYLFNKPAVDYRTGSTNAWLVGYQVGVLRGKLGSAVARLVLIDGSGNEFYRYPDASRGEVIDDGFYTDAIVVTMVPNVYLLAMSSPAGRKTPGSVSIRTLGQNPLEVLTYRDVNFPAEPGIESDLYFFDVNSDGRKELLVEQQVLHYSTGQKEIQRQVFSLESNNQSFADVTSSYQSQLATIFATAKGDPATPKITQQSRPYDPTPFETSAP